MLTRTSASSNQRLKLIYPPALAAQARICMLVLFLLQTLGACSDHEAPVSQYEHASQGVYAAALTNGGEKLVIGSINHGGSLWSTRDSERLYNWNHRQGEFSQITQIGFSEDQGFVVTAGPQDLVLWNAETGEGDALWSTYSEILDIAVLRDAEFVLMGLSDHSAKLFDLKNGGTRRIYHHQDQVNTVDVFKPGNIAVTGSNDRLVKIWALNPGKLSGEAQQPLHTLEHNEAVQIARLSPDGSLLFTMAQYDGARIWDPITGQLKLELGLGDFAKKRGTLIRSAQFSNDGKLLLTGTSDRIIRLWDVESGDVMRTWQTPKRNGMDPQGLSVLALAFNAEGGYSAVTSDGVHHRLR